MLSYQSTFLPVYFLIASLFVYFSIWLILKTRVVELFIDKPDPRKVHQRIIPRVGGIAISAGFILFLQIWHFLLPSFPQLPSELYSALTFTAVAIMIVGLVDDMKTFEIHNRAKFLLELIIAAEVVFLNDIRLENIHLLNWDFSLGWLGIPITIIWIVGVTNAVNIIDGVDGLAGSIITVSFATIAILTGLGSDLSIMIMCVIMSGFVSGFLMHNKSPARVFLGDTGSLFLGMITGIVSIYLVSRDVRPYPILIAPLIVGLPVMDVFVAMTRRFMKKAFSGVHWLRALNAMSVADNEHMHHRLIFRGLTHTETTLVLVIFHAIICMSAIMVTYTSNFQNVMLLIYILVLGIWLLYKLHFFDRINTVIEAQKRKILPKRLLVAIVNAGDVLKTSAVCYNQDLFQFVFRSKEEAESEKIKYSAVVIEQNSEPIVDVLNLSKSIFIQNTCPVIVIASQDEELPEKLLDSVLEQGSFLFLRKPVYIPILMKALNRLVQKSKGWETVQVTEDTRQFYMQVVMHEEI